MSRDAPIEKLQAQFARYVLSVNDFEEALSYLYAKPAAGDVVARRALLIAAIVAYARPFTQNETEGSATATSSVALSLPKLLSGDQLTLHSALLEMRHKAIAHSTSKIRPVLHAPHGELTYSAGHLVFDPLTQSIDRKMFASICEALHAACKSAMLELNSKISKPEGAA